MAGKLTRCALCVLHQVLLTISSAVFQAGGLVVVLVEVSRKPYLASIVPVIVNAILNEHQIIVDIVAFVSKGDFPRSRLGEKQRGKVLAGWVTRKLRTMAQFAIRDLDAEAMGADVGDPNRMSTGSIRSSVIPAGASSLRNVEHAPQILEQEEFDMQMNRMSYMPAGGQQSAMSDDQPTPTGYVQGVSSDVGGQGSGQSSGGRGYFDDTQSSSGEYSDAPPPVVGRKPVGSSGPTHVPGDAQSEDTGAPRLRMQLPGVDGREGFQLWSDNKDTADEEEDWTRDAIMHMNLAGDMNPR